MPVFGVPVLIGGKRAIAVHTAHAETGADLTDYTGQFDGIAIGDATHATYGARVGVAVFMGCGPFNRTVSSFTIGGVTPTQVSGARVVHTATDVAVMDCFVAAGVTGTTADFDIILSGAAQRMGLQVFALYAADTTASDTMTATGTPGSGTIDCPANGTVIMASYAYGSGAARTFTLTGVTEASGSDATIEGTKTHVAGSEAFTEAQTGLSLSSTASGSILQMVTSAVSFGPV